MISFGNFGTGKILYSSLKVHCKSPHSWPSSCGKKQFLHSRLRRSWRNCFSPRLLTHSWGDLQCTFRDSQKILNSYTRGFATRIGIFQSQNCQMISLGHSHVESENLLMKLQGRKFHTFQEKSSQTKGKRSFLLCRGKCSIGTFH